MHADLPLSMADDLEYNSRWHGAELAYIEEERSLTHRQLLSRGLRLGSAIYEAGLRHQDRIGVLAMNCIEYGEVVASAQCSGFVLATVNFRLAPPEIAYIINDGRPKILFFEAQYLAVVEQLRSHLPSVDVYVCIGGEASWAENYEKFIARGDEVGPPIRSREEDIFCLIYTSGTTGRPKGCIWGQREFRKTAAMSAFKTELQQPDRIMLVMPMFHKGGLAMSQSQLAVGGTCCLFRQFDANALLAAIHRDKISIVYLAPTMVQMLLEQPGVEEADLSSVRTVMYSAAPMPLPVLKRAMELFPGCGFVNLYGQTEICTFSLSSTQHRPFGDERDIKRLTSVGKPHGNHVQVRIVDEDDNDCPVGVPGEILARSGAMLRGYWNNHSASLEALRNGWVHTGDVGKLDEDGFLYLVDRKKDVIISGGENIYSREVEDAVVTHPAVSECAVIGIPDEKWGESVCAVITLRPGRYVADQELIEYVRTRIAGYKKPKYIITLDELPKLVTGKVNKLELRQRYALKQEAPAV
ncbi:class I adenylate-forming enzyme family protein [Pseudomonas sp. BF-R-19]|uniref:class I adenylate-forming enzyme family protein n=1 Tax=Pseudomonas sp. BF-R-19 TaxID=2832397 RepID=UPI001CBF5871|nr:long-chain-fatty-acid--CoA ligase [Pseudomonas sp. BF-R-19]